MGYNTQHTLTTDPPKARDSIRDAFRLANNGWNPFEGPGSFSCVDQARSISIAHPSVIITIAGVGEEDGDEWVLHAHAGKTELHERDEWDRPGPSADMVARRAELRAKYGGNS